MESTQRRIFDSSASVRRVAGTFLFVVMMVVVALGAPGGDLAAMPTIDRNSIGYFNHEMWRTVRAEHPAIRPVAEAIRAVTNDPLQQLTLVNDVTTLLVEYDSDLRVYGVDDFHATLDEMIARRRAAGWAYLRDDCDGRAVFAAHLLAALGIPFQLKASYWKEHAWVVARVNGIDYDLLDLRANAPETKTFGYKVFGRFFVRPSHPPPIFDWRAAWAHRTGRNIRIGITLGMLTLDSNRYAMHQRHARDWTQIAPNAPLPPPDDARTLLAGIAAFPYGESLRVGALAGEAAPAKPTTANRALSVTTSANPGPK